MFQEIKKTYRELPVNVKGFAIRALFLFVAWLLLYYLILLPIGIPDTQLTTFVQWGTTKLLSFFYHNVYFNDYAIYINGRPTVAIIAPCNGLELMVLYWGFLLCIPTTLQRAISFAVGGFIVICLLNFARCAALAVMTLHHHALTNFAHHYAFNLIVYGVIFYGWILYSKNLRHEV